MEAHHARDVAESFGTDPARYDRTRPRYPAALIDAVLARSPGPDVLDVGLGTGIVARQLRAAGARVLGVEVDARMAEFARRDGETEVEVARFEDWEPGGRSFDLVVAGQTWHWIDPVAGAQKAAAVLRPGGRLAVFWNVFDAPPDVAGPFAEVYGRVLPGLPAFTQAMPGLEVYRPLLEKAADGMRASGALAAPERWRFDWSREYTRAEWLDVVPTFGGHSRLSPEQLDALLDGLGAAVDAAGGRFTMRYAAMVVTATRA